MLEPMNYFLKHWHRIFFFSKFVGNFNRFRHSPKNCIKHPWAPIYNVICRRRAPSLGSAASFLWIAVTHLNKTWPFHCLMIIIFFYLQWLINLYNYITSLKLWASCDGYLLFSYQLVSRKNVNFSTLYSYHILQNKPDNLNSLMFFLGTCYFTWTIFVFAKPYQNYLSVLVSVLVSVSVFSLTYL